MNERLATAQWEPQPEVSQKLRYDFRNFWLGRAEDETAIGYRDDRHICLVCGNRSGKGASIIINNLCYWPGSAVVIDPKGENATVTAARRGRGDKHCEGMGQAVHVLDPFHAAQVDDGYRSAFNPLDALDPNNEETIDEAARLANAIVVVKDDRPDPFFDEAARSMVRGLILHVLSAPDFEPHERTLLMVRDLILRGDWRVAQEMASNGETEIDPPHMLLWRSLCANPAFNFVVAGAGTHLLNMMVNSPKTFESVLQTVIVNTEFIDSPGMRRVLAKSDFKLSELKTRAEGMTLYLSLPQRHMDMHYRWLRMMIALTTTEMELVPGQPASGHPVLMVLDEFAGLKRMTAIENAVAQIAGFGVKLFFVLQSFEQLRGTYKDHWETFLANAGLKIFFSVEDNFTREYVSKQMGEMEIVREVRSSNEGQSDTDSFADGRSHSDGHSQSFTQGDSQSDTYGTSQTKTTGRSSSTTESSSEGANWSRSRSETDSTSQGQNWSQGTSSGVNYRKQSFFFLFQRIDPNSVSYSEGTNSSFGGSTGTSHSVSDGASSGGSHGTSRGSTAGVSDSEAQGSSQSRTGGSSRSATDGRSTTDGTSQTTTRATGRTSGTGRAETIHHRPLLRPEEFSKLFARIDDKTHPAYPGFALVLIAGRDPLVVKRAYYFEDVQFIDCFSPHPDHRFLPAVEEDVLGVRPLLDQLRAAEGGTALTAKCLISPHRVVAAGEPVFRFEHVPHDGSTVSVRAPCAGKAVRVGGLSLAEFYRNNKKVPVCHGSVLTVKHYGQPGPRVDPLAELNAACARLSQYARQLLSEPAGVRKVSALRIFIWSAIALGAVLAGFAVWRFREPVGAFLETLFEIVAGLVMLAIFIGVILAGIYIYIKASEKVETARGFYAEHLSTAAARSRFIRRWYLETVEKAVGKLKRGRR
jgi:type IV secretory pathway TraG/TraD family ATPase VirD4